MIKDPQTGDLKDELLGERVLSAIIEMNVKKERLPEILGIIKEIIPQLDSVFTLDVVTLLEPGLTIPPDILAGIEEAGFNWRPNAKINLGLGKITE